MNGERSPLLTRSLPDSVVQSLQNASRASTPPHPASSLSPSGRARWKTRMSFILILVTETLERTAFYGLICNMFVFLNSNPMSWASYNATTVIFLLNGIAYVTAVFGGWLADSRLGKFRTIAVFFCIYVVGFAFWPMFYPYPYAKAHDNPGPAEWCRVDSNNSASETVVPLQSENCWWAVYLSVAIVGVGYGIVRVNIIPYGAFQVSDEGQQAMRAYFNWFYWCINIGSLIAFGVFGYVQQERSYFYGYIAPNVILVVAVIVFLSGSCLYQHQAPVGSPITTIRRVVCEAFHTYRYQRRRRDTELLASSPPQSVPCCLDYAKVRHGGSFHDSTVEEIKVVCKIVLVFTSLVPYWIVYYQMQTTFMWQAFHMKLDFSDEDSKEAAVERSFRVPAAWLSLFNVVFILALLPILDRVVYPLLDRRGVSPSLRVRMMIGMVFSVLAMLVAGCVEKHRMDIYWRNETNHTHWQMIGSTFYEAANVSILFQIPQYVLVAIGELLTSIAGLELAYIYAPRSMQGIIMALYWFSQGVGSLFGSATIQWFKGVWFTAFDYGNINCHTYKEAQETCHLDYYFFFVGGLQLVGILVFVSVTWGLDIGRPVPLRVQRQGHTLVRPTDSPVLSASNNRSVDMPRIPYIRPRMINSSQSPETSD